MQTQEAEVRDSLVAAMNLSALREREAAETLTSFDGSEQPALRTSLDDAERFLGTVASKLDVDRARFERILDQHQIELKRIHEEWRAEIVKNSSAAAKDLDHQVASRRKALDALTASTFKPVVENLDSPFLIWATPANILTDSQIEPFASRAKFFFQSTARSGTRQLDFYYLWRNPVDRFAVINIDGYLVLNGFCRAGENGGFLPGDRRTSISLTTKMVPLEWWNQPPTSPLFQSSQSEVVLAFSASGGGGFGDVGAIETRTLSRSSGLGYNFFMIPPNGVTVIKYSLIASFSRGSNGSGSVIVDFDSGAFRVMSPFVTIQILT